MIKTIHDNDTQALYSGRCPRRWKEIRSQAESKLAQLDAGTTVDYLRAPPGHRLEKLKGDRAGQWSIRISRRWRVCFRWEDADAWEVEIADYH